MSSVSFGQVIPFPDLYNFNDSFLLGSINEKTILNKGIKIFKINKKFSYNYYLIEDSFLDTEKHKKIYVDPYWSITGNDTILRFGNQHVNTRNSYLIDKLKLIVTNKKSNTILDDDQIIIKYEYSNDKGTIKGISEITGVIEDSTFVFLHPPRSNGFNFLQYAPFPKIHINYSHIAWIDVIEIPAKRDFNLPALTLEYTYTKVDDTTIVFKGEKITCQVIKSEVTKNNFGITSGATFIFNNELGFISMSYSVEINNCLQKIVFNLENIEN